MFDGPELSSSFKLLDKQQLIEYSDDIELIFIEQPKLTLSESELTTPKDRWLYFVKNAGSLAFIPEGLVLEPSIRQAFEIANLAGLTSAELEAQEKRFDFIRLQKGAVKKGWKEGHEVGREKGREEGREEGKRQTAQAIARNLLALLDDDTIAAKTGLTAYEVARLRKELPARNL